MTHLLHSLSLVQNVAIVSERGDIKGYLKIAIQQTKRLTSPAIQDVTNEQTKLLKTYKNAGALTKIVFDDEKYFQVRREICRKMNHNY